MGTYDSGLYEEGLYDSGATGGPVIPPGVVVPLETGARWGILLHEPMSTTPFGALTKATGRSVTFNLEDPSSCSFTVNGSEAETSLLDELVTDIVWTRNGEALPARFRLGPSDDAIDPTGHKVTYSASDYRSLLDRRYITPETGSIGTTAAPGEEQFDLAWQMITSTQSSSGGNLGISKHATWASSGINRLEAWEEGTQIGSAITEMGMRRGPSGVLGFDWDIDHNLKMMMWTPVRGSVTGYVVAWGANCYEVNRSISPEDYANFVAVQYANKNGDEIIVEAVSADIASRPEGRWETWAGGTFATTGEATSAAQGQLSTLQGMTPAYEVKLMPGTWDPDLCWLGDTVGLVIRKGRLDITDTVYRVQSIKVDIADNGTETVTLVMGSPLLDVAARLWYYGRSINRLERR